MGKPINWPATCRKVLEIVRKEQQRVNTAMSTGLIDRARKDLGREPSCPTCAEATKHCCRMYVVTTLLDAIPIAERVLAMDNADELLNRLEVHATRMLPHTCESWFDAQVPCAFLVDERCSIYDVRPQPCMTHLAWSPPRCCSGWNKEQLVTTAPSMEGSLTILACARYLERNLLGICRRNSRDLPLPYTDTLPAAVLTAVRALRSETEHRFLRVLEEAQTPWEQLTRVRTA